jgi:hypothetical protein
MRNILDIFQHARRVFSSLWLHEQTESENRK